MEKADVAAYLDRIGTRRPFEIDFDALRHLQERHLESIPFETFGFQFKEPIVLGDAVLDKVVRGRGGAGAELNSLFASLLRELGFKVSLLGARVVGPDGRLGPLNGHLVLRVDHHEPWLVDVGYWFAARKPLRLDLRHTQSDFEGEFQVVDAPDGDVDVLRDGNPLYRVEVRERSLTDFEAPLWWLRTAPDSPLDSALWASIATPEGRIKLKGRVLTRFENGKRTIEVLEDDEFLDEVRKSFGIELDRLPDLPGQDPV
ncbi:N-hydroxyarylamine O-acetyltransferase [Amycolatopsis xylanica]|uniref:N-hydroxyarylamine O-acetyltransferase n=1 Tax=Amycolatopsis xylanica TaxID=589385 RepID=A0A1H3P4K1_9PSEU|nr:arylamine N-acetyltransferase [Amycolatopsis xylanica]SDY96037.1 N-hydroxyarylamine O-acetyltransferase [Amycolatopsis xylanica]